MARIISQVDPNTGRRTKVGAVEGRTIEDRQSALTSTFGITNREANKLNNSDIAQMLNSPISSNSLFSQPSFDIQTQAPSTATKGLLAQFEAAGDQFTKNLQTQADTSRQREESAFDALIREIGGQATPSQLQADAYKESVDPLQAEVTGLNNKLAQEQHSLRRQLEALEKNPEGLFGGQLQNEMQRVERDSLKTQADISVILAAKQGMLSDAQEIADRAVKAQTEYQQKRIDLLQMNYDRNKSLFDKDEQRAFEVSMNNREQALATERQNKTDIYNLAIEASKAGASSATMQSILGAKTPEEALSNAGSIFGPKASVPSLQFVSATANQPAGVFNPKTGEFTAIDSGTTSTADTANLQIVNDSTDILTSPAFNSTFGISNTIQRMIPSTDAYYLAQKVNNFTSQLTLAARGQLKGQGQISDFEGKMLRDAQTALTLNLSPQQATREITKARGAIRTSSGLTARIKITDPTSGQSQYVEAGQEGINQAIADGLVVEYQ